MADRGWRKFMSERDRAFDDWKGGPVVFGLGERPAVIVVDDYYSVLGLERKPFFESIEDWPMSCGLEGWEAIDRTVELLSAARAAGAPVIYLHGMDNFPSPWGNRNRGERHSHLPAEVLARANEIVEEVAPEPGDLVLQKAAASGFHGTPLLFHLNYHSIDTVIVCGETTSGCVRATVVDAATYRYQVGVVEECCFDRTEASHWMNLYDMDQKYADVMDLPSTIDYLRSHTKSLAAPAVPAEAGRVMATKGAGS